MNVHDLHPYLHVRDAEQAIQFYRDVFGARELMRLVDPNGRIGHAELSFAGSKIMLSDEYPQYGITSPTTVGGTGVTLHIHVDNADAVIERAVAAGARVAIPVQDHFYGERSGAILDPFGHRWTIGHSIEAVTPEEMQRRYVTA
jgi:uncharacterized glyoxalase superfamily protein PhnB